MTSNRIVEVAIMGPRRFYTEDQAARIEKGEDVGKPAGREGYIACVAIQKGEELINLSGSAYDKDEAAKLVLNIAAEQHGLTYDGYKLIGPVMPERVTV